MTDYVAIVLIYGGSSWHRAPTEERALAGVARRVRADWGKLFKIPKDWAVTATLVDATGCENVSWDADGIWSWNGDARTRIPADRISHRTVKLT